MKLYFAGHSTFGNRGCEALVRSTVGLIRQRLPEATFVVPSSAPSLDRVQWPQAESLGVEFLPAAPFPGALKWWNRAVRLLPPVEKWVVPTHTLPPATLDALRRCDAMIVSGGDVISLDYGLASLYDWTGHVDNAKLLGKPVALWAASVGPFTAKPHVETFIRKHLAGYDSMSVRESATKTYLDRLCGKDVAQVADPAFTLEPEVFDHAPMMPSGDAGCLGFNVSPLIRGYRPTDASRRELDQQIIEFLRHVVDNTALGILLIPHVGPLDGGDQNSDHHYMAGLLAQARLSAQRVRLAPRMLNAAQLKHLISQCRYFIGARTHATVAALSMGVPTLSIAYSVKAKGINRDLFGHTDHVLDTPKVTRATLTEGLTRLEADESAIKDLLARRIPQVRQDSRRAVDVFLTTFSVAQP